MSSRPQPNASRNAQARPNGEVEGNSAYEPNSTVRTVVLNDCEVSVASKLLGILIGLEIDRSNELKRMVECERGSCGDQDRNVLVEFARQIFVHRAKRSQFFDQVMFGEGAWDMLLALYIGERSDTRYHTVSGLLSFAGVPPSTAHRCLEYLEHEELISRRPHPTDRRVIYITLTDDGREALDKYFSNMIAT